MANVWDDIRTALQEAEDTDRALNMYAKRMAALLPGRLRHCNGADLKKLKEELRDYNIHTGKWREK